MPLFQDSLIFESDGMTKFLELRLLLGSLEAFFILLTNQTLVLYFAGELQRDRD